MLRSLRLRFLAPLGLLVVSAQVTTPLSALQLGGRPAEEWALTLESGRRLGSLEIEEVVARMGLQQGDVVADIGAGTGVFSVSLARAAGPSGTVIAVEVDAGFLPMIAQKAVDGGVENIHPVLGAFEDPKLPRRDVDVAFFHDVIHHIEKRQEYFLATAAYMAPGQPHRGRRLPRRPPSSPAWRPAGATDHVAGGDRADGGRRVRSDPGVRALRREIFRGVHEEGLGV